jgi:hypothetical protein
MPLAPTPTLSGDLLSVSRFLNSPAAIQRRLRTFTDLRFIADQLLTQRFNSQGGAVLYEQLETQVNDRTPESVSPGSEYPFANTPEGTAGLAAIAKWGQKVKLTDEEIARNRFGGQAIDRKLRKTVNTIISQVDTITMSAIYSAVTATFDVTAGGGAAWTDASPTILRDILRAKAEIIGLNEGYNPDTLGLNDEAYAYLMADEKISTLRRREATDNPVYTGEVETIAGLTIVTGPRITNPLVLDSTQLGGMADEMDGAPGYAVSDLGVQIKPIRMDELDAWHLQGRRKTVPVVQEPGAAIELVNTGLS